MTQKLLILLILLLIILAGENYFFERPVIPEATKLRNENIIKDVSDINDRKILLSIEKIYGGAYYGFLTNENGQVIELNWNPCHHISTEELNLLVKMKNINKIYDLQITNNDQLSQFNSKQYSLISYWPSDPNGQSDLSIKDYGPFTNLQFKK